MAAISRWFSVHEASGPLRWATLLYLAHILCQAWIGSSQTFLALSIIALIVAVWRRKARVAPDPLYLPLVVFLAGSTLSALLAPAPLRSLPEIGEWFMFLALPLALTLYRQEPSRVSGVLRAFAILTLLLSGWGLFQYTVLGHRELENRITGPAPHVMTYSGILLPLALGSLILFLSRRRPSLALLAIVSNAALALTFTRSAWVGWMVGLIAAVALWRPRLLGWILPLLLLLVTFAPMPIFARLASSVDLEQYSNLDRLRMLEAGIEMIRDRPLLGVGPGNIEHAYPLYRAADAPRFFVPHLHNNVVQLWAERGVIPALAYLVFVTMALWRLGRIASISPRERAIATASFAGVAGLLVAGAFEYNFGDSEVLMTLLAVIALGVHGDCGDRPADSNPSN